MITLELLQFVEAVQGKSFETIREGNKTSAVEIIDS